MPLRGGEVGRLMANAILNFHFDYPYPSLILQAFWCHCLTYLYHVLLPNQYRIFAESGAPILDWWLVSECLISVIKSIHEMQICWQMGVWTSVEVQCTIVWMRVSRRLKSGPVRPSTWHRLKVWTSVEVFKSKCWVVQCTALLGGVEVLKCGWGWKSLIYHPRQAPGQEVDRGPNWFYFTL